MRLEISATTCEEMHRFDSCLTSHQHLTKINKPTSAGISSEPARDGNKVEGLASSPHATPWPWPPATVFHPPPPPPHTKVIGEVGMKGREGE